MMYSCIEIMIKKFFFFFSRFFWSSSIIYLWHGDIFRFVMRTSFVSQFSNYISEFNKKYICECVYVFFFCFFLFLWICVTICICKFLFFSCIMFNHLAKTVRFHNNNNNTCPLPVLFPLSLNKPLMYIYIIVIVCLCLLVPWEDMSARQQFKKKNNQ